MPLHEGALPAPVSPYAVSKLAGEHYCRCFDKIYGLETVALRYFNVFGPRQDPAGQYAAVVPIFIERVCAGRPVVVYGDGEQTRDFVYVEDVVRANQLAATVDDVPGQCLNIASGDESSVNELLAMVCRLAGRDDVAVRHESVRAGDVPHSCADIGLARRALGYEPQVTLEEGLERTLEAHKEESA
jgi:nucleoside-diphosphate-sugar epimerase